MRPRIHADAAAKAAADYAAKKKKRAAKKERAAQKERNRIEQLNSQPPSFPQSYILREKLREAVQNNRPSDEVVALVDELERQEQMEAYNREMRYEAELDAQREQMTQAVLKRGGMLTRGCYLTGAPEGGGLLVLGLPAVTISDAQQARERIGGRRIRHGNQDDQSAQEQPEESEHQHFDKALLKYRPDSGDVSVPWRSALRCYRSKCQRLVLGILPQDIDKPALTARYHCDLHRPLSEFRRHENVKTP